MPEDEPAAADAEAPADSDVLVIVAFMLDTTAKGFVVLVAEAEMRVEFEALTEREVIDDEAAVVVVLLVVGA